jgi:integrase
MSSEMTQVQQATQHAAARRRPSTARTLGHALESTFTNHWARSKSASVMRKVVDVLVREDVGSCKLTDIDTTSLRDYGESLLRGGKAPATVNRRMSAINVALGFAAERGEIALRPTIPRWAENNLKDRYMSPDEEAQVFAWLDGKAAEQANDPEADGGWSYVAALARFLLDSGFRFSEAFKFALVGDYADLKHATTKNGKGRRIPLTKRAKAAAEAMLASPLHQRMRCARGKRPWDYISHRWNRATKAAGCPDVTLHILRHTCASRLVQRGIPIYTVSKWLGHSSVQVTERYAKLAPDSLAAALAALESN